MNGSEFIRRHHERLVELWLEQAGRSASARGMESPALRNIMPKYVEALAEADEDLGTFSDSRRRHLESHLGTRIRQGFRVEEVVDEVLLLGRCAQRISEERPRQEDMLSPHAVARLWDELHRAAAALSEMFTIHLIFDEQIEKRYLRLLREIASASLVPGTTPFRERLSEVVALVMEAMGASSAALSLYDATSRRLLSAAAAGAQPMEDFAVSTDPSSFVGQVAASEEPTEIEGVPTTTLSIPDTLRQSGIQSILGVRLPARHRLVGVVYVGIRERRAFAAREARRLETLGEQLSLHLDNASLFAELQDKVHALESERALRERFVSTLAHDLRGPLSVAKLTAQVLLSRASSAAGPIDEAACTLVQRIDRNLERTDRMIRDLLDANRIHAGERLPLRLEPCDAAEIVRETIDELKTAIGDRLSVAGDEHVRGVWSPDDLRRSIWNLASNAAKYGAPDRPIVVAVRRNDESAILSVHNEGNPIPVEEQNGRLFAPFARARSAREGRTTGWGLGLALVNGSAIAHGGRLSVESSEAAGTTFTLTLPLDSRPFQR